MAASVLRSAAARIHRRRSGPQAPAGERLALASLRSVLDERSQDSRWALHPDGVLGRALVTETGSAVTFPVVLGGAVSLTARAMLLPHDWRDRDGAIRAWVSSRSGGEAERIVWEGRLEASDHAQPRGHHVEVALAAGTTALTLGTDVLRTGPSFPLGRAIWLEPALADPGAPRAARRGNADPSAAGIKPLISVLVPVHDPPVEMLEQAIDSVREQTYSELGALPHRRRLARSRRHRDAGALRRVGRPHPPGSPR